MDDNNDKKQKIKLYLIMLMMLFAGTASTLFFKA